MGKNILLFVLIFLMISGYSYRGYALDPETHKKINEYVTITMLNNFSLDDYLMANLNFLKGKDEPINGAEVYKWIRDGGYYEDKPPDGVAYRRSINHFHDPLLDQGYKGPWYTFGFLSGLSSTEWMLLPQDTQSPYGFYSWHDVREYYYKALTASEQDTRNTYFAETFRGLGQLMHLIQDVSVPAHTRNDFHVLYNYEKWVKVNEDGIFKHNPIFFNGTINNVVSFVDTNQYNGTNPGITTSTTIGLSEYTNANFFSEDTINASNFSNPMFTEDTQIVERAFINTLWDETYPRHYYLKACCGETNNGQGYLLSAVDFLDYYRREYPYLSSLLSEIPVLDDNVYEDYASLLLPRAIGYSAGLMEYFFRGEMEFSHIPNSGKITVTNRSPEKVDGVFSLYYDATDGTRKSISDGIWSLSLEAGEASNPLSFTEPIDLGEAKPYILVFEGNLGSESNAVVGRVGSCPEEFKLTAHDTAKDDWFGYSVAISGDVAIVGSPWDDDAGDWSGAAYVFIRNGERWEEQAKLTASDAAAQDGFGYSVAISGDVAIVGAPYDHKETGFPYEIGSAYVFVRNGAVWKEQTKLTPSDAAEDEDKSFGWTVAIDGDVAIIGAIDDSDAGDDSGAAYIFVRNGDTWVQKQKITASDAAEDDYFGWSVSISGDMAIVGTWFANSAYVFAYNGVTWEEQVNLSPGDIARGDWFGYSVAINGDVAIVGSPLDDDAGNSSGSAYVFVHNGSMWEEKQKLTASDAATSGFFGSSIAISGDVTIVGADSSAGAAYVFSCKGDTWEEQKKLTASDAAVGDCFGWSVTISKGVAIVGSYGDDDTGINSGAAYIKYYNGCSP